MESVRILIADDQTIAQHGLRSLLESVSGLEIVLDLLAHGYTNAEIGQRLGLSPKTISNNISNVLLKLQATDRAKLMLMALKAGLGRQHQE
jgi:DNA-binding NarL/FixJ family response regulator